MNKKKKKRRNRPNKSNQKLEKSSAKSEQNEVASQDNMQMNTKKEKSVAPEYPKIIDGNIRPDLKELDEKDVKLLEECADKIVKRRMSVAAIFTLESFKPLNFIGSQLMSFLDPSISLFFNLPGYDSIARLLEERKNLEKFISLLEYKEALFLWQRKENTRLKQEEKLK